MDNRFFFLKQKIARPRLSKSPSKKSSLQKYFIKDEYSIKY